MSTPPSPTSHTGPDVYILPLTEVSLPVAKQPGRSVQLLRSTDLGRHSLLYIKEIGHGWFGKVLLGEVHSGLSSTQAVVKELKASASVQDQMHFLEEARPYRSLQHPALVQCLAQCTEVTPYLVVMEFCPLGDVKGYLRSCRVADSMTPDPLLLQRMACEITSGLLHLHKNNFTHSDLALRNCLLTSDINVKIGDYGLSQKKYKDDYFVTSDQTWIPLRWIAPELVDEVHGNLLVVDQTKESNIWSLGVTIWELFELGNQPYRHYSDRQVLSYAVKDQQLKLSKPLLKYPLADRWYEVMQFCWLQPDQRPNAEEVHLLLSYLCAKGASEAEEDFERRWNSMRPNTSHPNIHGAAALAINIPLSSTNSSFPLLEQFPTGDDYHSESGDDILTVTETSHGLNFEYKWEQAQAEQHYHSSSTTGTLGQSNPHCQEVYYPPGGIVGGCAVEGLALEVSPSYYEPKQLHTPGVVPVLSAHSPPVSNEYYIRIEEPIQSNIGMNFTLCAYSPEFGDSHGSFLTGSGDSGECMNCPPEAKPDIYWSADVHKSSAYDSDTSPAISLTMEPLLGHDSPLRAWESGHYVSYKDRDGGYYYEPSPPKVMEHYLIRDPTEPPQESWGSRSLRQALGELEDPLGISPSPGSPPQGYGDPYLENIQGSIIGKNVTGGYYDMMGSLRKTMPGSHSVCIDMASGGAIFVGRDDSDSDEEEDIFVERRRRSWSTSNPVNTNTRTLRQNSYADFHYTMPMTDVEDMWPEEQTLPYHMSKPVDYLETTVKSNTCLVHGRHITSNPSPECNSYIHMCHEPREAEVYPVPCCQALSSSHFVDPLTGALVRNCFMIDCIPGKTMTLPQKDQHLGQVPLSAGHIVSKIESSREGAKQFDISEQYVDIAIGETNSKQEKALHQDASPTDPKTEITNIYSQLEKSPSELPKSEPESEMSKTVDSGVDRGRSSISLVEIDDCSDDDITDVTSGIFGEFTVEVETVDYANPTFKSLQKQVGTPDSMDSIDIPSTACSIETLSPASIHPSSSPKAVDSGYDTENNESPEFVLKEPHELQDSKPFQPLGKVTAGTNFVSEKQEIKRAEDEKLVDNIDTVMALTRSESNDGELKALSDKTPYRDSAYFSDYDAGKDKESEEDINELEDQKDGLEEFVNKEELLLPQKETYEDENLLPSTKDSEKTPEKADDATSNILSKIDEGLSACDTIGSVSLSPSDNEVSVIKDNLDDDDKNPIVDSDLSVEIALPESEISDSNALLGPDVKQEESFTQVDTEDSQISSEVDVANTKIESISELLVEENEEAIVKDVSCTVLSEEELASQKETAERTCSSIHEGLESRSKDLEEGGRKRSSIRSGSPPPPLEGLVSHTDGEEADEEDGDSEDSDESDEELRTYSIQEQSEESEDELTVPIIVSDCSDAHKLRSLLKMPTLLGDSLSDEMESKKKVVSFFDDVTVFLFDQESPTKELADHSFPLGGESSKPNVKSKMQNQQEKVNASDDSSDGNISEESAGFEWEDDFPLLPLPTSSKGSPPDITAKSSLPTGSTKPAAQGSRFTVSPSNVSRFSITHVSDSDMDSAGGSSEDGERE
ncbi:serine/threonine-protein kinase LMTK1 isoform X2 [Pseudorasbora parva]